MSDNTTRTKESIDIWNSPNEKKVRVNIYRALSQNAGLKNELGAIPDIHIELMDYDKYTMNIVALAKVKELHQISTGMPV